jgi:hypothetical protein
MPGVAAAVMRGRWGSESVYYEQRGGPDIALVPLSSASLDISSIATNEDRADYAAVRNNVFDGESIDRVYRGHGDGVQLLALTGRRIMMVERTAWAGRLALTSIPYGRITAVSFLADDDHPIDAATTIGIRVTSLSFEMHCADATQASQAHDLISWTMLY